MSIVQRKDDAAGLVCWLENVGRKDIDLVGGKNASLGEMINSLSAASIRVPGGFAITAQAYRFFLRENGLEKPMAAILDAWREGRSGLRETGQSLRSLLAEALIPPVLKDRIREAYADLCLRHGAQDVDVAVRSSATAEDLPDASFAGQQESFLNVTGIDEVLQACRECFASLYTDRAISYREEKGFDQLELALSVGVQKMVRAGSGCSGVMFSLDPESGFPDVVVINGNFGLGEPVVQGMVTPDEFMVFKPLLDRPGIKPIIKKELGDKRLKMVYSAAHGGTTELLETSEAERSRFVLSDEQVLELARWCARIEKHYGCPMDVEWAMDGDSGELYVVQARPETVQSRAGAGSFRSYALKESGPVLLKGLALGEAIASGTVRVMHAADDMDSFQDGEILVTEMTDPGWVPLMKRAGGLITNAGGRTSHAAIVSRELGLPAIVGCSEANTVLKNDQQVTLSCAEGEQGVVYEGLLDYEVSELSLEGLPETRTRLMLNVADPAMAFRWWRLPARGVGLARMEFIINNNIQVHPMALVHFDKVTDEAARAHIEALTRAYEDKCEYFVERLALDVGRIAAAQYPEPVIVRMSDFKTNEYAHLTGGRQFEPKEENPMLGFRGASRYYHPRYREGFDLECQAIRRVREAMGLDNVVIMIPFCRTLDEADKVLAVLEENGLKRGKRGLEVYVMCEVPSNVILADEFADRFDGFSIGSNDLTQLTLGIDRDSDELMSLFDERNPAVKAMISHVIQAARRKGRKVGICGQGPSDYFDFVVFLVE